jgi:putative flippase GtrA
MIRSLLATRFARFLLVGGFAAAVNVLARIAFNAVVSYEIAIVLAFMVALTVAFVLNRAFVFGSTGAAVPQYARFGVVNVAALAQVWIVSVGLARWVFPAVDMHWHPETVAHVIGVLVPVFTSYVAHKYYTFR